VALESPCPFGRLLTQSENSKRMSEASSLVGRSEALILYGTARQTYLEYLRKQIVLNQRVDVLATEVLGYNVEPFHLQMLQVQSLHPDNLQLVGRGFGKALSLSTPIPTSSGWTTMGAISVGDMVLDDRGLPCRVIGETTVQHNRVCYEVVFDDGTSITADADHRWLTAEWESEPTVKTTKQIEESLAQGVEHYVCWKLEKSGEERTRFIIAVNSVDSVPVKCIQVDSPSSLFLCGRGMIPTHNSTICTVTKVIWYLCCYPKARIVIASKTVKQAQARLKEIAAQLETNELLIELFGEFYNKELWNARELEISQRYDPKFKNSPGAKATDSTPTIACVGAKGSIAGAHFDIEFSDDLIDKTNSHSELTRGEVNDWYNGTFTPMLDPKDPDIPFRKHRHRVGTRYHYLDQYGTWIKRARQDFKDGVSDDDRMWINVVPAYDYKNTQGDQYLDLGLGVYSGQGTGMSPWADRFGIKELLKTKRQIGRLAFEAQYLNDIDSMNGEIFDYDHFVETPRHEVEAIYKDMDFWIGCDLAISQKNTADDSAFVVVGRVGRKKDTAKYFVVDIVAGKFRFNQQTMHIKRLYDKWNGIGAGVKQIGIETVAYQLAQFQNLQDTFPEIKEKLKKITPRKGTDKVSRAWNRATLMESRRVHLMYEDKKVGGEIIRSTIGWKLREQMVLFPNGDNDDIFDAFDHAITRAEKHRTSTRRSEQDEEYGII